MNAMSLCRFLMSLSICAIPVLTRGEKVMTPGEWIPVSSNVEVSGLKVSQGGATFGYIHDGHWAVFGPLDLSDGFVDRVEIELASPRTSGHIMIRLDDATGPKVADIPILATGDYRTYAVCQGDAEQLSGTHRLVMQFQGDQNLCNVKAFRFLKPDQPSSTKLIKKKKALSMEAFESEMEAMLAAARADIETYRMTSVKIAAQPGATVNVKQTRHAFEFGTAINRRGFVPNGKISEVDQAHYKRLLKANFNSVVHENAMKWYSNERQQDKHTYDDAEAMLAWCSANELPTRGHCVFWGRDKLVQQWIKDLDDEALRSKLQERAKLYMERYKGRVPEHDINNEMVHCHYYEKRLGPGIREDMFEWCHAFDPDATLYVNDYSILSGGDADRYVAQVKGFLAAGMKVGGIGVQGHFGSRVNGPKVKATLDRLAQFDLPIKVTEYDANTADPRDKARALVTLYATAFAHPSVDGIYMWGFWENSHWRPKAALWKADWSETLAAQWYRDLVFKRWWTDAENQVDANGKCEMRLFYGDYDVTTNGQTRRFKIRKDRPDVVIDCTASDSRKWGVVR
jgi:endo-1,4-beta-xylanase